MSAENNMKLSNSNRSEVFFVELRFVCDTNPCPVTPVGLYIRIWNRKMSSARDCLHSTQLFSLLLNCSNNTDIEIGLRSRAFVHEV
jgi:hypothetical protein